MPIISHLDLDLIERYHQGDRRSIIFKISRMLRQKMKRIQRCISARINRIFLCSSVQKSQGVHLVILISFYTVLTDSIIYFR
jgi:hypothetical protein